MSKIIIYKTLTNENYLFYELNGVVATINVKTKEHEINEYETIEEMHRLIKNGTLIPLNEIDELLYGVTND